MFLTISKQTPCCVSCFYFVLFLLSAVTLRNNTHTHLHNIAHIQNVTTKSHPKKKTNKKKAIKTIKLSMSTVENIRLGLSLHRSSNNFKSKSSSVSMTLYIKYTICNEINVFFFFLFVIVFFLFVFVFDFMFVSLISFVLCLCVCVLLWHCEWGFVRPCAFGCSFPHSRNSNYMQTKTTTNPLTPAIPSFFLSPCFLTNSNIQKAMKTHKRNSRGKH